MEKYEQIPSNTQLRDLPTMVTFYFMDLLRRCENQITSQCFVPPHTHWNHWNLRRIDIRMYIYPDNQMQTILAKIVESNIFQMFFF